MPLSQGVTFCQLFCYSTSHNHGSWKVSLVSKGAISTTMIMGGKLFSCFVCLGEGCHRFFPCRLTVYRWLFPLGGWAPITPVKYLTMVFHHLRPSWDDPPSIRFQPLGGKKSHKAPHLPNPWGVLKTSDRMMNLVIFTIKTHLGFTLSEPSIAPENG